MGRLKELFEGKMVTVIFNKTWKIIKADEWSGNPDPRET